MHTKKFNIKYILTHPIQYQSPLIKYLVKKGVKISVLYRSDISVKEYFDQGFGKKIKWDTSLLRGYNFDFLNFTVFKEKRYETKCRLGCRHTRFRYVSGSFKTCFDALNLIFRLERFL